MDDPPENWMFVNSYRNNYKKQNLFRKLLIKELGDDAFVLTVTDSVTLFKLLNSSVIQSTANGDK